MPGLFVDDLEYYRQRQSQEEEAARAASCPEARERHEELAEAYRLRTRLIVEAPETERETA